MKNSKSAVVAVSASSATKFSRQSKSKGKSSHKTSFKNLAQEEQDQKSTSKSVKKSTTVKPISVANSAKKSTVHSKSVFEPAKKSTVHSKSVKNSTKEEKCTGLTFEDCEMAILRQAVDKMQKIQGKEKTQSAEIKQIWEIVEEFIRANKLVIYGGTAINLLLPSADQFYDKDVELPDYDFYSDDALNHAKKLTDVYLAAGFKDSEAKSGVHHGTYKVYVNYMAVADITSMPEGLLKNIRKDATTVGGMFCAPPNLLRMGMYLELSRPRGDNTRFEKVLKRLALLNKHYPIEADSCGKAVFRRTMSKQSIAAKVYDITRDCLIGEGVVFFGGYAMSFYEKHLKTKGEKQDVQKIADFDVLSERAKEVAEKVVSELRTKGNIKDAKVVTHEEVGELIATHYEIMAGEDTLAFVYEPLACHSYNVVEEGKQSVRVATIDTMLSFYLAFCYADRDYYQDSGMRNRILCMAHMLFTVQETNRLSQKGVLKRFSLDCIGKQPSKEDLFIVKAAKRKQLEKGMPEYEEWFLHYPPQKNSGSVSASRRPVADDTDMSSSSSSRSSRSSSRSSSSRSSSSRSSSSRRKSAKKSSSRRSKFSRNSPTPSRMRRSTVRRPWFASAASKKSVAKKGSILKWLGF